MFILLSRDIGNVEGSSFSGVLSTEVQESVQEKGTLYGCVYTIHHPSLPDNGLYNAYKLPQILFFQI